MPTTRLSAVALPVSNCLPHNARTALRRLPIQPIPEYKAISRPTMPTPRGLATTLSIRATIGSAISFGSIAAISLSNRASNSWLLRSTMPPTENPTIRIGTSDRNEK